MLQDACARPYDHAGIINALAYSYANGKGVVPDLERGFSHYSKAAALGFPIGYSNCAQCFRFGTRVTEDLCEAAALFRQGIFHGDDHDEVLPALREIQAADESAAAPYGDWEPCWLMHQFVPRDMKRVMMTLLLWHQRAGCVASLLPKHLIFDICFWVCTLPRRAALTKE